MPSTDTMAVLKKASAGLTYQSESDAPWEVFSWGKAEGELTPDKMKQLAKVKGPVQEVPVAAFFRDLTTEQDWFGPEEKATAAKYRGLQKAVESSLTGAKVYKVGKRQVGVYVVGKTTA